MKTLKKVLSLALVLVMALSFATLVSAKSADEYADASKITYAEAVDTLSGLGILNGYDNGNFGPQDKLTREQAAKIITYLIIGDAAANLKTSATSFSDVPADRWSAPFIQYCANRGIVNGIGGGLYAPEYYVTGAEFAKMLLGALGYGKNGEYVGDDWSINVLVDAQNLGILTLGVNYMEPATREQVAQYAYNAITSAKCFFVAFNKSKDIYEAIESKGTLADQLGLEPSDPVVINGKNHFMWMRNNKPLTGKLWAYATEKVLGVSKMGASLDDLSNPAHPSFIAEADTDKEVTYYLNGEEVSKEELEENIAIGVIVTLIDTNFNGKYDVVSAIKREVAQLEGDVTIGVTGVISMPGVLSSGVYAKDVVGYEGLKKGDYVLYYFDKATNTHNIVKAQKVQGVMTEGSNAFVILDGTYRPASGLVENPLPEFVSNPQNYNVPVTAYLDEAGAIIVIATDAPAETSLSYGFVIDYQHFGSLANSALVKIVKEDKTISVYEQAAGANGVVTDLTDALKLSASNTRVFVSYYFNDSGKIVVNVASSTAGTVSADYTAKSSVIRINGSDYYVTSATKIIYFANGAAIDLSKVTVATGYKNVVDLDATTPVNFVVAPNGSALTLLVVDATVTLDATYHYAYVPAGTAPTMRVLNGVLVYDYLVYVNGKAVKLTSESDELFTETGLVKYTLSDTGFVTETSQTEEDGIFAPEAGYGEVTFIDEGSYFIFESDEDEVGTVLVDEKTKFYSVGLDGTITAGSIFKSTSAIGCVILNYAAQNNVATEVYFMTTYKF